MSTRMNEEDWAQHRWRSFGACLPRRGRKAANESSVPGSDALLHGGERALACASGALRPLEFPCGSASTG